MTVTQTPVRPADPASLADALHREGFAIARGLLPSALIGDLDRDLDPVFAATPFCQGDFYGARTKRFGRLLARSPLVERLVRAPAVLETAQAILGPWTDTLQLNLTQAIELHSGALAQFPHRDQDMWRGPTGDIEYLLNVIWPLSPFTVENGATVVWPRSHGAAACDTARDPGRPVTAICDPGDAIVFLGSTLHGAGPNRSAAPRRGIIISYCLGWLKPYENQWLAYPPEVARDFSRPLSELVGYVQHRPNLGNYEGQCPSVLFEGPPRAPLAAVDALRPDQSALLQLHVDAQRRSAAAP